MRAATKITFFDEHGEKFFGEGPCLLLHAIEETGSLRAASISMGLAYTKALRMIRHAEEALGFSLTTRSVERGMPDEGQQAFVLDLIEQRVIHVVREKEELLVRAHLLGQLQGLQQHVIVE